MLAGGVVDWCVLSVCWWSGGVVWVECLLVEWCGLSAC